MWDWQGGTPSDLRESYTFWRRSDGKYGFQHKLIYNGRNVKLGPYCNLHDYHWFRWSKGDQRSKAWLGTYDYGLPFTPESVLE